MLLKQDISAAKSAQEAIELAALNWQVEQWPMSATNGKIRIAAHDRLANVRADTNNILGIVSPKYHVWQNTRAFEFLDEIVVEGRGRWHEAGTLDAGAKVWVSLKLDEFDVTGGDSHESFAVFTNTHDGSGGGDVVLEVMRLVCTNGMTKRVREKRGTIRHLGNMEANVRAAFTSLDLASRLTVEYMEQANTLAARAPKEKEIAAYFAALLRDKSMRQVKEVGNQLMANLHHHKNRVQGRTSWWSAVNAYTQWVDHQRKYRSDHNKLRSQRYGQAGEDKSKAMDLALSHSA